jgi:DNA-binding LacI/PurR family transcriptional regulator
VLDAAEALGYQPHPVARQLARRSGTRIVFAVRDARPDILRDPFVTRATAAMAAEGRAILAEGIALRASDIDLVLINGYGYPAWRGGPMFEAGIA